MSDGIEVYKAIAACMADLAKEGIAKNKQNAQQGYKFRGIDDVYGALAPILSKHGLCFLPRILSRNCEERQTAKGGTLFYVTVEGEFDLVSSADGSRHTVRTFGEAMDSADKATNKAMSAAYKYAAFQAFCIPCEGEDADATTHDVKPNKPARAPAAPAAAEIPKTHTSLYMKLAEMCGGDEAAMEVKLQAESQFPGSTAKMTLDALKSGKPSEKWVGMTLGKLRKEAPDTPAICNECRKPLADNGRCSNLECPNGEPF